MTARNDFAQRFIILKENYNLTFSDLACLLGVKNKANINLWVKAQSSFPNEEMLVFISRIFGVSLDWLMGNVNIDSPYREDLIERIEEKILPIWERVYEAEGGCTISNNYKDAKKRGRFYNIGQRANLVYGAMSIFFNTLFMQFNFKQITDTDTDPLIKSKGKDYINNTKLIGTDSLYMSRMWPLLRGESSISDRPPYDLEATIQDAKKDIEMNKFKGLSKLDNLPNPLEW